MSELDCSNCCTCIICQDTFTRSNTTVEATVLGTCLQKLGTPTTLAIVSNALKLEGAGTGVLFVEGRDFFVMRSSFTVPTLNAGQELNIRFVFGYEDEDNYGFWNLQVIGASSFDNSYLTLWHRAEGTETKLKDAFWYGYTPTNTYNQMDTGEGLSGVTLFYDKVEGWTKIGFPYRTLSNQIQQGWYQFSGSPAGNKMGIRLGPVADTYVTLDNMAIYEPNSSDQTNCPDITIHTCTVDVAYPTGEVTVEIAGLVPTPTAPAGPCNEILGLNGTYVLSRADENATLYRHNGVPGNQLTAYKGGFRYTYVLSAPICNIKAIDFWWDGVAPFHDYGGYSWPYLCFNTEDPWGYFSQGFMEWRFVGNQGGIDTHWTGYKNSCADFDMTADVTCINTAYNINGHRFDYRDATVRVYV